MKELMIGLTQRITLVQPHGEKRDSLARDWYPFLTALGLPWVVLPNEAEAAVELASRLDLGGLILTGGDDIGAFPERDETEACLLSRFQEKSRPVVGVCRGFQFIHHWLGGEINPVNPGIHRARRHEIIIEGHAERVVNSYHNLTPVFPGEALPMMRPLAYCPADGSAEAAVVVGFLGLMWQPERETEPHQGGRGLLHNCLPGGCDT